MATDKTFNVFGVSKQNGEYKVRFANDIMRIKVLAKHGHEDIRLCELDEAVTKYAGIQKIQSMDEFQDAAAQAAIAEYLEDKAPKAPKAGPAIAKAKAPAKKDTKASREAEALAQAKQVAIEDLEDAPF
ncbi:MAG: hypothetical protein ACKOD7_03500 [Polynucleobacter victoriensis]